jgi:hypothetical protein
MLYPSRSTALRPLILPHVLVARLEQQLPLLLWHPDLESLVPLDAVCPLA